MKHTRSEKITTYILCLAILFGMIYFSNNYVKADSKIQDPNMRFSAYSYFEPKNIKRYSEYKRSNPIIRNADIVWMVNMDLDNGQYENVDLVDNPEDLLVLVNKHNSLPISYGPKKLKSIGNDQTMAPEAADAFKKLLEDAKKAGQEIIPQSGFRSYKTQSTIYEENSSNDPDEVDTYSARPGYSEHQTGLAVDLNVPYGGSLRDFVGTEQADWVAQNAYKYGFIVRYTDDNTMITGYMPEPWHIRYVGIENAQKIKDSQVESFEEYTAKYLNREND